MRNRLEHLACHLRTLHPAPEAVLTALRVPPGCNELDAVARACERALTQLCDHHDHDQLLVARDLIREILRLIPQNADLNRDNYRSIDDVPEDIDDLYRALPSRQFNEPWWCSTLREALLVRLLLHPDHTATQLLARSLRADSPILDFALQQPQKSPTIRIGLMLDCLKACGEANSPLARALADTLIHLEHLPKLRSEELHRENAAALNELQKRLERPEPALSPRERLTQLARDIGVAAMAQRREHHAPAAQRVPPQALLHDLLRRAERWHADERTTLEAVLMFGRIAVRLLRKPQPDPLIIIERDRHETWLRRILPPAPEFTRWLAGPGFSPVGREIHLPLPRRIGSAIAELVAEDRGVHALRILEKRLREFSRDCGQPLTLRRLSRVFEYELEGEAPDEALGTLLGLQDQARRDAGIHYFAPGSDFLTARFRSAVEAITARFDLDTGVVQWSAAPRTSSPYVGYSFRVSHESVQELVASLKSSARLERGRAGQERIIAAYNARVALLTVMYLASTGARPTGTTLPCLGDVSVADRAAIVSEKDALGYRSTRLVPLSGHFITEMKEFDHWAKSKHLLPARTPTDEPLAMLLGQDGGYVTPTLTACKQHVAGFAKHWLWPDDALRHLFRSRLSDMGCPSSWLRRVMGHHPPHGATDMPWTSRPQWAGLHDWAHLIDEHLKELGF